MPETSVDNRDAATEINTPAEPYSGNAEVSERGLAEGGQNNPPDNSIAGAELSATPIVNQSEQLVSRIIPEEGNIVEKTGPLVVVSGAENEGERGAVIALCKHAREKVVVGGQDSELPLNDLARFMAEQGQN